MSTESVAPAPAPQPEAKKPSVLKKILGYVVGLIVAAGAIYAFNYFSSDEAQAKVGDCANITGTSNNPTYKAVDCTSAEANYVVGQAFGSLSEPCKGDYVEYTHSQRRGPKTKLCLAPVLAEGTCYGEDGDNVNPKVVGCTETATFKVTKAVKDAAVPECAEGEKAFAFPEAKLNYCLGAPA
ncbi:hypothetical protein BBK82_11675 [Lentzea guizhouensis]|uniref:Uncharacterized protein n=1 Tax=Lentzea guizhouensis TaxID=1586287 RepID=A0A1B2HFX6_9PSEU|nr:hypothetical protein [Lentzea guizhouensis]ANZ36627.1 hypothetical protein BBK82_11675 [Lentzea guizhouensis]